ADGAMVFQSSVKQAQAGIETSSGGVLLVAAAGKSFAIAKAKAMDRIKKILKIWPDAKWRSDIAHAALQTEETSVSAVGNLPIVLGSSSPRRLELLGHLGLDFSVIKPETEEIPRDGEKPLDYVQRNAHDKNRWICDFLRKLEATSSLVICADTIVLVDGILLEKPGSPLEAKEMLTRLSGKRHTVYTAVSIARTARMAFEDELREFVVATDVLIKPMTSQEMDGYIATGEPFDKAGGYAAQGLGSFMVQEIHGSFSNVVGLPLAELGDVLTKDFLIPLWRDK
ncbi:MAG: Maf family nucleotide pyrophosphatase, partial [Proteobacteria bacterium]|nr:Maf family nucleotide pyrophosphatase [Pseudomonadota bacterium]